LLEDTILCAWRDVIAGLPGHGNPTRLLWMLKLPVAPSRGNQVPTISLKSVQYF
jgi:hypothetical protein